MNETIKELVGRLVSCEAAPFTQEQAESLAALGEEALREMAERYESTEEAPPEPQEPQEPQVEETELSLEEQIAALPGPVQELLKEAEDIKAEKKAALVTALAAAQDSLDEAALKLKSIPQLKELVGVLGIDKPEPNYTAPVHLNREADGDSNYADAPPSLREAVAKKRAAVN